jgi:GNAT superfamily N-acetyltransferase
MSAGDGTAMDAPILTGQVAIVPAAETGRAGLTAIFGAAPRPAAACGLVAYVDGVPAGWIAVQPQTAGPKPRGARSRRRASQEEEGGDAVWAVTSLAVRPGYRGRGLTYHLAKATIAFARDRGAQIIEVDPARTTPDRDGAWGEPHVGPAQVFTDAGFTRASAGVSVLRVDFRHAAAGASAEAPARLPRS